LENKDENTRGLTEATNGDRKEKNPSSMKINKIRKHNAGFTLIELTVVGIILVILVVLVIAAINSSKRDSTNTGADASARTINEAITRAVLKGDTNPVIYGEDANDIVAAATYLREQGLIQ
jgi:type II secretory pathway pseudopilin PulG